MKTGAENRRKTILAGTLATAALLAVGYQVWSLVGGGDSKPAPPPSIAPTTAPSSTSSAFTPSRPPVDSVAPASSASGNRTTSGPVLAGVNAEKLTTTASGIDPTLDEAAMLRTESLVYSGNGRNIFSGTLTPVVATLPTNVPKPRPNKTVVIPQPTATVAPVACPPACPPIPVKFFGTEKTADGKLHGFFQNSDDIYLASEGEIVARRFKIMSVTTNSARVQDLTNGFEQMLPLQN